MAMPDWVKKELRSNFVRASRAGRLAAKIEPRAARATYRARDDALRIELTNGAAITVPVKLIPGLKGAAPRDVRATPLWRALSPGPRQPTPAWSGLLAPEADSSCAGARRGAH